MSKKFRVYFIHINFFKKPNKKITIELKSYTAMLLYLFFDSLLSNCQKKMETEKDLGVFESRRSRGKKLLTRFSQNHVFKVCVHDFSGTAQPIGLKFLRKLYKYIFKWLIKGFF